MSSSPSSSPLLRRLLSFFLLRWFPLFSLRFPPCSACFFFFVESGKTCVVHRFFVVVIVTFVVISVSVFVVGGSV